MASGTSISNWKMERTMAQAQPAKVTVLHPTKVATPKHNLKLLARSKNYKYRFREKEKDPIIGIMWELAVEDGRSLTKLANESGLSTSSLHNWFFGNTMRPQRASISMLFKCLGYSMAVVRGGVIIREIPAHAPLHHKDTVK
jgi:lambda repressor-like predicted transcriptional regulator